MIEAAESNAPYYYHFDALGSVIALTDESGDAVQVYEYDAYGRVGAADPDHSNRFMFTGREFDKETGLYYYRERYYNAETGRFLQTDPTGYDDGMNVYTYCTNCPLSFIDPSGAIKRFWVREQNGKPWLRWETTGPYLTVPRALIEAPIEGQPWTIKQFFWYYVQNGTPEAWGEGPAPAPVDLGKVGLLEKFQDDPLVGSAEEWYKLQIMQKVKEAYAELDKIWHGQPGGSREVRYSDHSREYNFTKREYVKDLIALGGGFLYCDANGVVTSDGQYDVKVTFSINDWFIDVLDIRNKVPDSKGSLDYDDGMPYQIIGSWSETMSGRIT